MRGASRKFSYILHASNVVGDIKYFKLDERGRHGVRRKLCALHKLIDVLCFWRERL